MHHVENVCMGIPEWYSGQKIFITGSTGFMGKVLVEKLLRDCKDVDTFYLLVRSKRGVEPAQRRDIYLNSPVFDKIREKYPERFSKIKIIKGDVTQDDLGLSDNDKNELIENVTTIFHCAACVRFDQPLREAINMNLLGTNRMLKLAELMTNLKVFVHTSTAYCQCNENILEEKSYAPPHSPLGIAQMSQLLDSDVLDLVTPKLLKELPNTYAYTKALTEGLIAEYNGKLKVVIARPSIVIAALNEPIPGWVEGTNGPTGLLIGAGRGVIRSMHCNPTYPADALPVDITMNAMIAMAWERSFDESKDVKFVNITLSEENPLTWGFTIDTGREYLYQNPLCFSLWYPDGSIKSNYYHHLLCVIFFHYIPAYFVDALLVIFRQKPFMIRVQKKVSTGLKVLQYYTTKIWVFNNSNLRNLREKLNDHDKAVFNFDIRPMDWKKFIQLYIMGTRRYLLKETPETLPKAKILLKRLYFLDKLVSILFYGFLLYLLWTYCDVICNSIEFIFGETKNILIRIPRGSNTTISS